MSKDVQSFVSTCQHMSWKKGGFPAILLLFPGNDINKPFGCQHVCEKMPGWYCGIKIYLYNLFLLVEDIFLGKKDWQRSNQGKYPIRRSVCSDGSFI